MRCEPAEEFAARLSIVDAQEHVSAEVRRRPRPEHGRLDFVQVERRRVQRKIGGGGFRDGQHGRILSWVRVHSRPGPRRQRFGLLIACALVADLVEELVDGLADLFSRPVSATVRFGWATYQPSAVIWCLTIQSFTSGL